MPAKQLQYCGIFYSYYNSYPILSYSILFSLVLTSLSFLAASADRSALLPRKQERKKKRKIVRVREGEPWGAIVRVRNTEGAVEIEGES